jgi:dienelactone hydrolase
MKMRWLRRALLTALIGLSAIPTGCTDTQATDSGRELLMQVPVTDASGQIRELQARVCRPESDAPARLVLINHGSPPEAAARTRTRLGRCDSEAASWFLTRGYVVGFVLRRGYGETDGSFDEGTGDCSQPAFVKGGIETARDMNAAVDAMTRLPFVRPDGVIIVGQSAGGWGAIAYDGIPHPKVAAFVVMAGGRGGHHLNMPNNNCRPDLLAEAAGHFGTTATTPMLWIYTANDSFFAPPIAHAMFEDFTKAGGKADFHQIGPFGNDGHGLFFGRGGSSVWGPIVEDYLRQISEKVPKQ